MHILICTFISNYFDNHRLDRKFQKINIFLTYPWSFSTDSLVILAVERVSSGLERGDVFDELEEVLSKVFHLFSSSLFISTSILSSRSFATSLLGLLSVSSLGALQAHPTRL